MEFKDWLSIIAAVISVATFIITIFLNRQRDTVALKPMLVFTYKQDGWYIENVGNGPALDVIFTRLARDTDTIGFHARLPTIAKGGSLLLHFARRDSKKIFLTTYTDVHGIRYVSRSQHDVSSILKGWKTAIRPSDPEGLKRWWQLPDSDPASANHAGQTPGSAA